MVTAVSRANVPDTEKEKLLISVQAICVLLLKMSVSYILPLKAPAPLPATGVDTVAFKVWKNQLVAHVQQDVNHHYFMPGGQYATWRAAEDGTRIQQLADRDPDKLAIDNRRNELGNNGHSAEIRLLLTRRNAQLAKFVTHIATLCHHTENDDVTNHSTSLEWIFDYLKKHYGLMTKGANFMNISDHCYKQGVPHQTFYKQYRASFVDNLRARGDVVKFKNDLVLAEDEKLSPSFENAIVLWTLEKIDPRLPAKVKKNYGYQMSGDVTLKDLQPVIFENIPLLIEELDQAQIAKAFAAQTLNDEPTVNAMTTRNRNNYRPQRQAPSRNRLNNQQFQREQAISNHSLKPVLNKFCRICNLAGSDPKIYTSHEIGDCSRLTLRDMESLRNRLVLNGLVTIEPEEPSYVLQPGWDDAEASELQQQTEED